MAVRKTTRKAAGTRKGATEKAPEARKASRKKAPAAKRAPAKRAATSKPARKKTAAEKTSKKKGVSSIAVNLGNVFGLRPRVNTSFRQEDFQTARRVLEEESYATLEEAARAVAEHALELSNDPTNRRGPKRRR